MLESYYFFDYLIEADPKIASADKLFECQMVDHAYYGFGHNRCIGGAQVACRYALF